MNKIIKYRPYRSYAWFVPGVLGIGVLAFIAVGYSFTNLDIHILLFLVIGIISFCLTKVLYDSSNVTILLGQDGVRVCGGRHSGYHYLSWEDLEYAYYARNYKGFLFLVLSPHLLSQEEVKRVVNVGANSSKIFVESVIVIHLDATQNVTQLEELIASKATHIDRI